MPHVALFVKTHTMKNLLIGFIPIFSVVTVISTQASAQVLSELYYDECFVIDEHGNMGDVKDMLCEVKIDKGRQLVAICFPSGVQQVLKDSKLVSRGMLSGGQDDGVNDMNVTETYQGFDNDGLIWTVDVNYYETAIRTQRQPGKVYFFRKNKEL